MKQENKRNAYKMEKKIEKEVQTLSQLFERSQTKLDAIQEKHGSDVEMKVEKQAKTAYIEL